MLSSAKISISAKTASESPERLMKTDGILRMDFSKSDPNIQHLFTDKK